MKPSEVLEELEKLRPHWKKATLAAIAALVLAAAGIAAASVIEGWAKHLSDYPAPAPSPTFTVQVVLPPQPTSDPVPSVTERPPARPTLDDPRTPEQIRSDNREFLLRHFYGDPWCFMTSDGIGECSKTKGDCNSRAPRGSRCVKPEPPYSCMEIETSKSARPNTTFPACYLSMADCSKARTSPGTTPLSECSTWTPPGSTAGSTSADTK